MFRGMKTFYCLNCLKKFKGPDFEWNASAISAPVKCPYCGQMVNDHGATAYYIKKILHK